MKYENNRVLIVDDQREIHDDLTEMLRMAKPSADDLAAAFVHEEEKNFLPEFELLYADNGEEAYEIIAEGKEANCPIAVAYIDIRMPPGIDGIETIRRVRRIDRDIEIVIMTAYTDKLLPEIVQGLELLHKLLYIRKPFTHEEIQQITMSLIGKWNIERQLSEKQWQLITSHRRLEAVLNATGDAIAMHDNTGHLIFANQLYEKLLGLKESELKKLSPRDLKARIKEQFRESDLGDMEGNFPPNGGKLVETTSAGQEPKLFYCSTPLVYDSRQEIIGSLVVYRDVSKEIEAEQMKAELQHLRTELETTYLFPNIIGNSPAVQQVYKLMKQAAESDITVLISGESGTGKELVANALHFSSPRKNGPFVALDCAAIPETLIESELFGHERGAFTGATTQRIGAFERADGGTLFLDEIGDMPYILQGKMLRVLQEREIQRVGGTTSIPIDIRVITATNKNLDRAIRAGKFRKDLFYRVAAFPITIPSLRERREDIPLLARHFLDRYAAHTDKSISGISTLALRLLLQYDWPGNVRELENAIARAVLLETSSMLQANNLPSQLSPVIASASDQSAPMAILPLTEIEQQALIYALEITDNNITQAARALGINRATLHRKLKKYDITRD